MESFQNDKFTVGDKAVFLGSRGSRYGYNRRLDKYIGTIVTIDGVYPDVIPRAYTFKEAGIEYWLSENCFKAILPDLPEFDAEQPLSMLLL